MTSMLLDFDVKCLSYYKHLANDSRKSIRQLGLHPQPCSQHILKCRTILSIISKQIVCFPSVFIEERLKYGLTSSKINRKGAKKVKILLQSSQYKHHSCLSEPSCCLCFFSSLLPKTSRIKLILRSFQKLVIVQCSKIVLKERQLESPKKVLMSINLVAINLKNEGQGFN